MIFLGDPDKITELLYEKHSGFLAPHIVPRRQIRKFVERLLLYLQQQIAAYEGAQHADEENEQNWDEEEEDPEEQGQYQEGDSQNIDELIHDF